MSWDGVAEKTAEGPRLLSHEGKGLKCQVTDVRTGGGGGAQKTGPPEAMRTASDCLVAWSNAGLVFWACPEAFLGRIHGVHLSLGHSQCGMCLRWQTQALEGRARRLSNGAALDHQLLLPILGQARGLRPRLLLL